MAIITISRQIASFGDEIAEKLAEQLGYTFITRQVLEAELVKHGLTEDKLSKYDEKKPGFWASLARDRDEYFDYLREAVYWHARNGNCIFIGRGGFAILKDVPGCYAVRLVASDSVRLERIMKEFSWPEKKARALMDESDANRDGFHKCFFNTDHDDPCSYDLVLNTDRINPETGAAVISDACKTTVSDKSAKEGLRQIGERLEAQKIVNHIVFDLQIPVHFLEARVKDEIITLHGIADSSAVIERVLDVARSLVPGKEITSGISLVHDYKAYP